jgi:hypothetical protein
VVWVPAFLAERLVELRQECLKLVCSFPRRILYGISAALISADEPEEGKKQSHPSHLMRYRQPPSGFESRPTILSTMKRACSFRSFRQQLGRKHRARPGVARKPGRSSSHESESCA